MTKVEFKLVNSADELISCVKPIFDYTRHHVAIIHQQHRKLITFKECET